MTTVVDAVRGRTRAEAADRSTTRIALLGVGQVGGAVSALVREAPLAREFTVVSGLVRDAARNRPHASHIPLTTEPQLALEQQPDLVIEALGGLEPARALVIEALRRGIPVVTANKSLLAAHGDLLLDEAAERGVPLRYEAAVLAGVPFLGTFAARPLARDITGFTGIVNGTTNYILSRMSDERASFAAALADAQRRGYAEPDPASDVDGIDAAEKLCVLLRHFGDWSVRTRDVQPKGISALTFGDIHAAAALGGVLKPVVSADWAVGLPNVFAGPAFVPAGHPLAAVHGVQNAIVLRNRIAGDLLFAGPGAGPRVTAATLLDDAVQIARGGDRAMKPARRTTRSVRPLQPETAWFIGVGGDDRAPETRIADLLAAYGVGVQRGINEPALGGPRNCWLITHRCTEDRIDQALAAVSAETRCETFRARAVER